MFPDLAGKPVVVQFKGEQSSSDGGAILLIAADERLGLIERLSSGLKDKRDPARVRHEIDELVAQRVYGIACGYADGNDAARLADDPVQKLLVGRDPIDGDALASQPTLSRFVIPGGASYLLTEVVANLTSALAAYEGLLSRCEAAPSSPELERVKEKYRRSIAWLRSVRDAGAAFDAATSSSGPTGKT